MTRYDTYAAALTASGFARATQKPDRFMKSAGEGAALVVNLFDAGDDVLCLTYGVTAIVDSEDMRRYFFENGEDNATIKLRHELYIADNEDAVIAEHTIRDILKGYATLDREGVRTAAKERQKAFLNRFHAVLKSMGYKRKGNNWQKALSNGRTIVFSAQKSAYSDRFYFNYALWGPGQNKYLPLVDGRIWAYGLHGSGYFDAVTAPARLRSNAALIDCFDWQLLTDGEAAALIDHVAGRLLPALEAMG